MNFLRTISLYTCFVFTAVFGLMPAAGNASEVGEAGGLIPMKGGLAAHSVPADSLPETQPAADADRGNDDHRAQVFEVEGSVTVLKRGAEDWQPAVKDMVLEEGDKIVTGAASHVDIAYDHFFLNIVRIQEKTKGEFRSIEPTQLFLEDGTVFSALDGLAGKTYQVSTPTAVAGVRGTTFDVSYESKTGSLETYVFPDKSTHLGEISLTSENGQETKLVEGQGFSEGVVGEIPHEKLENAKQFIEAVDHQFSEMREQGFVTLEASSDNKREPVEDRLADRAEDNKKIGGGPDDGGDTGGSGLKGDGSITSPGDLKMDGNVDALVDDAMTPPNAASFSDGEKGNTVEAFAERGGDRKPAGAPDQLLDGKKPQADYDKAVEFLGVGGVNTENQKGRGQIVNEFFNPKETPFVVTPDRVTGLDGGSQRGDDPADKKGALDHLFRGNQTAFDAAEFLYQGGNNLHQELAFRPEIKDQIVSSNKNDGTNGGNQGGDGQQGGSNSSSGKL